MGKPTNQNNTWEDEEKKKKQRLAAVCQQGTPTGTTPHSQPHYAHLRSPCDHIGGEAEHEGADEGADLPGGSLSSPPLLLQAALANTGNKSTSAGDRQLVRGLEARVCGCVAESHKRCTFVACDEGSDRVGGGGR